MAIKEKDKSFIYYCYISNKILYFGNTQLNLQFLCVLKELRKQKNIEFDDVVFETKNKELFKQFRNLQHIKINEESTIFHLDMDFIDDTIDEEEYPYINFKTSVVNTEKYIQLLQNKINIKNE